MDSLLASCAADLEDEGPRLVWADRVGGERGELVVVQCDLARGGWTPVEAAARRRRVRELLAARGFAWSGLAGIAKRCLYRRGFVVAAEIDAARLLAHRDAIFERAPLLQSITVSGVESRVGLDDQRTGKHPVALVEELIAAGVFDRVTGLEIDGAHTTIEIDTEFNPYETESHVDEVVELLASAGILERLRAFGIPGGVTKRGRDVLCGSRGLTRVERLEVPSMTTPGPLAALSALEIHGREIVPAGVVELRLRGVDDRALARLAEQPVAARIERLCLDSGELLDASPLARFPRLVSLAFTDMSIGRSGYPASQLAAARTFTRLQMPALRELQWVDHYLIDSTREVVTAFGSQLDVLDIRGIRGWTFPPDLAAQVAGEVRDGSWVKLPRLLHVGGRAPEPWLDPGIA